jgi:hypothetical protein
VTNLLPLERWREILGFSPWHFYGLSNSKVPMVSGCDELVRQYQWQAGDRAGRAEVCEAIETAEGLLQRYLGWRVAPQYTEQVVVWPRYGVQALDRVYPVDSHGDWLAVTLPNDGYVQALGIEALTLVGTVTVAGATLVYTDSDSDTLLDTFTATIAVPAGTLASEIGIYFAAADRLWGEDASERWRIQPARVSVSGVTATIRGRYWQLVKPILYEGISTTVPSGGGGANGLNPDTATNFVTSLEVYLRQTNADGTTTATSQAVLEWETRPWWGGSCVTTTPPSSALDPAAIAQAIARAGIRNSELGEVYAAKSLYDATSGTWHVVFPPAGGAPDRVTFRYLAGKALAADGQMERGMQPVVARLAAAELARPIAACRETNQELYRWQFDMTTAGRGDELFNTNDPDLLDNPFGFRRGHVWAWKQVRRLDLMGGITM